jgi:hypothetical protein
LCRGARVAAALNRPGNRPWRAGQARKVRVRRRGRTRGRVRLAHGAGSGMTGGPRLSAAAALERERSGLAAVVGQLGRAAALGCYGASEPEQAVGGAPADFGLLGHEQKMGQKRGRLRG